MQTINSASGASRQILSFDEQHRALRQQQRADNRARSVSRADSATIPLPSLPASQNRFLTRSQLDWPSATTTILRWSPTCPTKSESLSAVAASNGSSSVAVLSARIAGAVFGTAARRRLCFGVQPPRTVLPWGPCMPFRIAFPRKVVHRRLPDPGAAAPFRGTDGWSGAHEKAA
jgi:hypothetical protein